MPRLGVNISHVATIRQAWGGKEPDPVWAAAQAEIGGADTISIDLLESRRHITDRDVKLLRETLSAEFNMQIAPTPELLAVVMEIRPDVVTIVPDISKRKRAEQGYDVVSNRHDLADILAELRENRIPFVLFIDPDFRQVEASTLLGADGVELFTGRFVESRERLATAKELAKLREAVAASKDRQLRVILGHGLHYTHVPVLRMIPGVDQFNIGHSILSRAIMTGLVDAVREMKRLVT